MAIQTINLAVPGGDTPRSANTKINANFTDQTNAASRLVGTGAGQVPLAQDVLSVFLKTNPGRLSSGIDFNTLETGTRVVVPAAGSTNAPPTSQLVTQYIVTTLMWFPSTGVMQTAFSNQLAAMWVRFKGGNNIYSDWVLQSTSPTTYTTTTAAGANVVVDNTGALMRSTSSERYKDILAPLELDDAKYAQAMALKPIVYRSTAEADNPAHHYYSFSAEELGAYDPAFTLWRTTEAVTDANGNITEQPLAEKQAEGININALLAMSHAIAIKQDKLIKRLEARIAALEPKPVTNNP